MRCDTLIATVSNFANFFYIKSDWGILRQFQQIYILLPTTNRTISQREKKRRIIWDAGGKEIPGDLCVFFIHVYIHVLACIYSFNKYAIIQPSVQVFLFGNQKGFGIRVLGTFALNHIYRSGRSKQACLKLLLAQWKAVKMCLSVSFGLVSLHPCVEKKTTHKSKTPQNHTKKTTPKKIK